MRERHGMSTAPEYAIWKEMNRRCSTPTNKEYHNYGGRGIEVCEQWRHSFTTFYADMGKRPDGLQLDRINNDGDYNPENCRWTTPTVQANNTRLNRYFTIDGRTQTLAEWCRERGVRYGRVNGRLNRLGYTIEQALEV